MKLFGSLCDRSMTCAGPTHFRKLKMVDGAPAVQEMARRIHVRARVAVQHQVGRVVPFHGRAGVRVYLHAAHAVIVRQREVDNLGV